MPRSQNNEVAGGFTHWAIIDSEKVRANATLASAGISPIAIPAGGVVRDVAMHVLKRWTSGTITDVDVTIGDGADADGFVASYDIFETNASTGVTKWNDGAYFQGQDSAGATTSNVLNGKIYASADTIDVAFTSTGGNLDLLTGGELFVGANILDPDTYKKS